MKITKNQKKKYRIRNQLKKNNLNNRFRLSVFRSAGNFSAQIIDDIEQKTIISASSLDKDLKDKNNKNKKELSKSVAEKLATKAIEKKIDKIYLDRGSYKYHGRIKIFADTLREKGLDF